jgi:acyl carrier protein
MPPPSVPSSLPDRNSAGAGAALLRHSSAEVRTAYGRWKAEGAADAADAVVLAIVRDHIPERAVRASLNLEDRHVLISDLGFDSMAITEMVFAFEDLFEVTISNAEMMNLRSIGDLRAFVRSRLASPPAAAPRP